MRTLCRAATLTLLFCILFPGLPQTAHAEPVREETPAKPGVPVRIAPEVRLDAPRLGDLVADLEFVDSEGKKGRISDYADRNATVFAVHSLECPLSKKFTPVLGRMARELAERKVALVLVNPIEGVTAGEARKFQEEYGIEHLRYVLDPKGAFGRELGITTTTEAFVLDPSRTLRYRGAVDDRYGIGYSLDAPRMRPLVDAVDAVLASRRPEIGATTAPGCALDFDIAPQPIEKVTWHNRVSRIIQNRCQHCHRPGEVGPFPLLDRKDAMRVKGMMKYVVENRVMPPWFAEGGAHSFSNDARLAEDERRDLLAWLDAGCPEGNAGDAVARLEWTDGWQIGEPDLVVETPRTFEVPAEGTIPYKYTKARVPIREDRWVRAMEIRPGAAEVVHHVLVTVRYPRRLRDQQPEFEDGLDGYFAVMVPGQGPTVFPEGMAKFLPAGSQLIFQMHYTPNGKPAQDRTRMGFLFADSAPDKVVETRGVSDVRFAIPPGAAAHAVSATHRFEEAADVLGFFPHMHLRGKAFRYEIRYPDGREELLLDIPAYDFNWQLFYRLEEPLRVPAGSTLRVTGWFDNSSENPANPAPESWVRFGEQTWEEMMVGYFDHVPAG